MKISKFSISSPRSLHSPNLTELYTMVNSSFNMGRKNLLRFYKKLKTFLEKLICRERYIEAFSEYLKHIRWWANMGYLNVLFA